MFAFSPVVIPPAKEWGSHVHVTGYWFMPEGAERLDPQLVDFINAGPPPVCVGFGSMIHPKAAEIQRTILTGLRQTRQRVVVLTGWTDWVNQEDSDQFYFTQHASHEWLFPRSRLIIHHGGAGTTAAALKSSVPSLVIPFAADQFFWARQVQRLGAGFTTLNLANLSPMKIVEAVRVCLEDEKIRVRTRFLADQIKAEDGVGVACQIIES